MTPAVTLSSSPSWHAGKDEGDEGDRSRALHTGSGQLGADTKGPGTKRRREVDARTRPGTAPLAGKSLGGNNRSRASARVGSLRRRRQPGDGWSQGEAHHGGSARAPHYRDNRDARRRAR